MPLMSTWRVGSASCSATRCASDALAGFDVRYGRSTPSTFSGAKARAPSAATTAESTPPERPITTRSTRAELTSSRRNETRRSQTSAGWTSSSLMLQRVLGAQSREQRHVAGELRSEDPGLLVASQGHLRARAPQRRRIDARLCDSRFDALHMGAGVGVRIEDAALASEPD